MQHFKKYLFFAGDSWLGYSQLKMCRCLGWPAKVSGAEAGRSSSCRARAMARARAEAEAEAEADNMSTTINYTIAFNMTLNHADAVGPASLLVTKLPQELCRIVGMYSGNNCTLCDEKKASLITHGAAALFDVYCIPCFTGLTDPAGCQPTVPDQLENEVLLPPGWDDTDFEWEADVDDVSY